MSLRRSYGAIALCLFSLSNYANEADIEIIVDAKSNSSIDQPSTLYSTVDAKQIRGSGAKTINHVFETLLNLPVSGDSVGTGALGMPDLGGYGETARANTLILLNGYPLNNPTLETPNISSIPLESISKIDVFSQGASTLFGNGAVGGVVNIVTLPTSLNDQANAKISIGSFGRVSTTARISRVVGEDLSLKLIGDLMSKDGYRNHTDVKNSFGSLHLTKIHETGSLELSQSNGFQQRQDSGAASIAETALDRRAAGRETDLDIRSQITNLSYASASHGSRYAVHVNHRQSIQQGTDTNSSKQVTNVGSLNLNQRALDGRYIRGLEITSSTYDSPWAAEDRYQNTFDLYGKIHHELGSYRAGLGFRGAFVSNDLSDTLKKEQAVAGGEVSLTHSIGKSSYTIKADRSFRYGNLDENALTTNSEILKPQIADTLSAGIDIDSFQASLFKSWINNEIIYDSVASANANIDTTSRTGLQISTVSELHPGTEMTARLRWIDATIESGNFVDKKIPDVAPISASLSLTHPLTDRSSVMVSTIYKSSRYPVSDYDNDQPKGNQYTRTDVAYNLNFGASRLSLAIANLFDRKFDSYYIDAWNGLRRTPAEPRNFSAVFSSEF
jgi:iron complex outermembrane receptor protein